MARKKVGGKGKPPGGRVKTRRRSERPPAAKPKAGARPLSWAAVLIVVAVIVFVLGRPLLKDPKIVSGSEDRHVILITLDTTRADHLGCYGYANASTPNLDRLAKEGVLFENARAQAPITSPSHAGILTGTQPSYHNVRGNLESLPAEGLDTIAEVFSENGFRTGAVIGAFVLSSRYGFARGFSSYIDDFPSQLEKQSSMPEKPAQVVVTHALRWLELNRSNPSFLWVHLFDPHAPYAAPEPFGSRFKSKPYDGEIAYMDHWIGRILDGLNEMGLGERTTIAVVGDHGEALREHGEDTHSFFLYNSTLSVPLIFWAPGKIPSGRRIPELVRATDVMPTLLDLAGLGRPASVQGVSLVGAWDEAEAAVPPSLPSVAFTDEFYKGFGWAPLRALERDSWKFIRLPRPELYDLRSDPGEMQNLAAEYPERISRMDQDLTRTIEADRGHLSAAERAPVDPGTLEQLMSLGYISGGGETTDLNPDVDGMIDPKDRRTYFEGHQRLTTLRSAGRLEEAEAVARELIAEDASPPIVHYWLGQALWFKSERDPDPVIMREAATHLRIAAAIAEYRISCLVYIGIIHAQLHELEDARTAFEEILKISPDEPMALSNLTRVYAELGDWESVVRSGEKLLEVAPADPNAPAVRQTVRRAKEILSSQTAPISQ